MIWSRLVSVFKKKVVNAEVQIPAAAPAGVVIERKKLPPLPARVDVVSNQDKHFKKVITTEMMSFKQSAEHFSAGDAGFNNSWFQWAGLGAISSGVVVVNTAIAVIAAFGLIIAPVSAGIALAVSLLGVIGGIGFNIYMSRAKRSEYKRAEKMLDRDTIEEDVKRFAETLSAVLHDQLQHCTRHEADMLAKASCTVVTQAMLRGKIKSFDELLSPASLSQLLSTHASFASRHKFQTKTADNKSQNTRDILKGLVNSEPLTAVKLTTKRLADYGLASDGERQPLLAQALSSQSLFARNDTHQTCRLMPVPPSTPSPRR